MAGEFARSPPGAGHDEYRPCRPAAREAARPAALPSSRSLIESPMPDLPTLPPIAGEPISVLLLAGGEASQVVETVGAWKSHLDTLSRPYEILYVDDAAESRADALNAAFAPFSANVRVLRAAEQRGIGAALRVGLAAAQHPLLFYAECDSRYRPEDLKLLLYEIVNVHLATGCRADAAAPVGLRLL